MSRFLRIILFFDLPVVSSKNRKDYARFHKSLIQNGYIMMQESVYSKLVINRQTKELEVNRLKGFLPKDGLVQILTVTEKQFARIDTVLGEALSHKEISTIDRLVVL